LKTHTIRSGDTLSALAKRFGTTVKELAKANNITNPNKIMAGQKLTIPDGFDRPGSSPSRPSSSSGNTGGTSSAAPANNTGATRASGPVKDNDGRQFPTSADGTPIFRQGDPQWGSRRLGTGSSLSAAGCAMTSMAMAVSKITGNVINPGEMDQYLDKNGGYVGNGLVWGKAAQMGGLGASKAAFNFDTINKQIDAGRPVVIGVDYKAGSNGGANGTDHWMTVTGRGTQNGKPVYFVNDPATGKQITMQREGNRLVGGPQGYKTTGELVVLSGGNPRPGTAAPAPSGPSAPTTPENKPASRADLKEMTLPSGDLEKGMRGPEVEQLQKALVKTGHLTQAAMNTGPGIFGEKTFAALKAFQADNGVDAIGRYGPKTRAAFEKLGAKVGGATTPAPTGPTGPVKGNNDLSGFSSNKYDGLINEMSQKYNVPARLIKAVIQQESAFNPNAQSPAGATGLMQLMPATARSLGVTNPRDPRQSIEGGTKYLAQMLKAQKGDVRLALAAYNAGPGNVAKYGGIPPFKETQNYVKKIYAWYTGAGPA
jgi:peptidoglycan hydrolase-like protein with peptidoglycan-binding domain